MNANERIALRLLSKVTAHDGGCWLWTGARLPAGYGLLGTPKGMSRLAHRISYEIFVGPIPAGLNIDHLCRNTSCVNPAHLEPVTQRENVARGDAGLATGARQRAKVECPRGHAYDSENTYVSSAGKRHCKTCLRDGDRERKRATRAARKVAS